MGTRYKPSGPQESNINSASCPRSRCQECGDHVTSLVSGICKDCVAVREFCMRFQSQQCSVCGKWYSTSDSSGGSHEEKVCDSCEGAIIAEACSGDLHCAAARSSAAKEQSHDDSQANPALERIESMLYQVM